MSLAAPPLAPAIGPERLVGWRDAPIAPDGAYVLYWMAAARRTTWNLALERAIALAQALGKPLLVFEGLRAGYPHACARFHRFVLDGMRDNAAACAAAGVGYFPWVEPRAGDGRGLLAALAAQAACVVVDDTPTFFLPRAIAAFARECPVRLEGVDGVGLLPLRLAPGPFATALAFRRFGQRHWPTWLGRGPRPDPLAGVALPPCPVPAAAARWAPASPAVLGGDLSAIAVPGAIGPAGPAGGPRAGAARLAAFVAGRLARYGERGDPADPVESGLSPYMHFGHVGAHQVVAAILGAAGWEPTRLGPGAAGARAGWWGLPEPHEAFLDQVVTWRELGHHEAHHRPAAYATYDALPAWAIATLGKHAADPRPWRYEAAGFEAAATHDPLWNAIQRQLVRDGGVHSYLRMLWGKQILAWSASPREAFETMLTLNDRYALDGRDPNAVSGIAWVLGRYDRPWGPEREVFGTVRYMTSANTARKFRLAAYLARYGEG